MNTRTLSELYRTARFWALSVLFHALDRAQDSVAKAAVDELFRPSRS